MFVTTADIRSEAPSAHKSKAAKIEKWLEGIPLPTKTAFPTVFLIAAGISESDFEWVSRNVSKSKGDETKLENALRAVNATKADALFKGGKSKAVTDRDIVAKFSKAELEKAAMEFAKKSTDAQATTTTDTAIDSKTDDTASKNSTMIDPTDRSALYLAILNFTGKPADEVDAFLVAKEDRKVDNAATSEESTSSTSTATTTTDPAPVPTTDQNQTEQQTEKSEIPAAASTHPGTDKVDNSGAGRDDSSAVTNDSAPSSVSDSSASSGE